MSKAFAIIEHTPGYADFYPELLDYLKQQFSGVESGIQGDAWIWITRNDQKVSVDSFYSMQFEISADRNHELLQSVIETIRKKYPLEIYPKPFER